MKHDTHRPVLLSETLAALDPRPGEVVVDATVGRGGHATAIAARLSPGGRLIGLDLDPVSLEAARAALAATGVEFSLHHSNFAALPSVLAAAGVEQVGALLADLGVSSPQIDDPARGFSYRRPGPLDMRMDPTRGATAADLLARLSREELARALLELGDEEDAEAIATLIVEARESAPIRTTDELSALVCAARNFTRERAERAKLHPAARTFQALRLLVNREIANLERLLAVLPSVLKPGGRAVILSFHSGEDRRVKHAFRAGLENGTWAAIADEPIQASEAEREENPRARSVRLRWARRAQ